MTSTSSSDSGAPSVLGDLISGYNSRLAAVAPKSVLSQLGLMAIVSAAILIGFSVLRPHNRTVYAPKAKYSADQKKPPPIGNGIFDWIGPVMTVKEPFMMDTIGLDAVAFLRFLRMCRWMFTFIALITSAVLIPIDFTYTKANVAQSQFSWLSACTLQDVKGDRLYIHIAAEYVVTAIALLFIWTNYSKMVQLKWQFFRSNEYQMSLHARSLVVTAVPKRLQSDDGLVMMLNELRIPYPTTAVHIGRRVGNLPQLIAEHDASVCKLEQVLTTYLRNPNKIPSKRPTMTIGGFLGCGGRKVDAIDYLTRKIQDAAERVEAARERISEKRPENYGFASFSAVPFAHIVAKKLHGKKLKGTHFELAPHPQDIIWENITWTDGQRARSNFMGSIFLVIFFMLYLIPLVGVAFLANLAAVANYVGFLNSWENASNWSFSFFQGIVPPLLSVMLQLILPYIIRWIAKGQGADTHTKLDRKVLGRYVGFLIFSQFFIFSILGVLFNITSQVVADVNKKESFSEIFQQIKAVPRNVQTTYVEQSSYWLSWMPLRGASALFDLSQLLNLVWITFRTHAFGRTPREIREWTKPREFDYPIYYANGIFMAAVAFVYAPLAPLVSVLAAIAFFASSIVYKYQLLLVFVTARESGGRLWRVVINRLLVCLVFMQLFMVLTIGLKIDWFRAIAAAPPVIAVFTFKLLIQRRFDDRLRWYLPNQEEIATAVVHHSDARKNRLQRRFGHPSLHSELYTPQIHKKSEHLLPQVYHGRLSQTEEKIDGRFVDGAQIAGLTFATMQEHDLEYDRAQYLREQQEDAWETGSMASTALDGKGPTDPSKAELFSSQRAAYLQHGPNRPYAASSTGTPASEAGDPIELSRFPSRESNDHLLSFANVPPNRPPLPGYATPPRAGSGYATPPRAGSPYGMRAESPYGYPPGHRPGRSQASQSSLDMSAPQNPYWAPPPPPGHGFNGAPPAPGYAQHARQGSQGTLTRSPQGVPMMLDHSRQGSMASQHSGGFGGDQPWRR